MYVRSSDFVSMISTNTDSGQSSSMIGLVRLVAGFLRRALCDLVTAGSEKRVLGSNPSHPSPLLYVRIV